MKRPSFKVRCPMCGNLLGIIEDGQLIVKKKGRSVVMTVWEEAQIECENCRNRAEVHRFRDGDAPQWDGKLDSTGIEWEPSSKTT